MTRLFNMPKDFDRMPIGFYLRKGRTGRWHIGGQKSELPEGNYAVLGPIHIPEGPLKLPSLDFDGMLKPLDKLAKELKRLA